MKANNVVQEVYAARDTIRKNRSLIFQATYDGKIERVRELLKKNTQIRDEITRKYGVIIDH